MREFTFMRLATICGRNLSSSLVNLIGTEIQAKGARALDKRLKPGSRVIKFYGPALWNSGQGACIRPSAVLATKARGSSHCTMERWRVRAVFSV